MNIKTVISSMKESISDRFLFDVETDSSQILLNLTENKELRKKLFRIQRISKSSDVKKAFWKTILIAEINKPEELKDAIEWTASVKDALTDPETSDLYLFIVFKEDKINFEESVRIESTEQFCRKYVQRPGESPEQLIERTFLKKIKVTSTNEERIDPLNQALSLSSEKYNWFNKEEQEKWKKILLSNKTGNDLLEMLTEDIY